jgi:hypothetical protein
MEGTQRSLAREMRQPAAARGTVKERIVACRAESLAPLLAVPHEEVDQGARRGKEDADSALGAHGVRSTTPSAGSSVTLSRSAPSSPR